MRRLRVQVTVLVAMLGLLLVAWGTAIFLAARRAATRLSRDFVTMETSRRAYLLTGDGAAADAQFRAEINAVQEFQQVRRLSLRWRNLVPVVEGVADEYRAWVRTGHTELAPAASAGQGGRPGRGHRQRRPALPAALGPPGRPRGAAGPGPVGVRPQPGPDL